MYAMLRSKKLAFFVIFACLLLTAYFSTTSNRDLDQSGTDIPAFSETKDDAAASSPSLEERLVDTKEEDGYTVETYQEFEIYKNPDGTIQKVIPTSHFNYLRYASKE